MCCVVSVVGVCVGVFYKAGRSEGHEHVIFESMCNYGFFLLGLISRVY